MSLVLFIVAGLCFGAGVVAIATGVFPKPVPLGVLASNGRRGAPAVASSSPIDVLAGDVAETHAQDLAVSGVSVAKFVSDRIVNAVTFAFIPGVLFVLSVAGIVGFSPLLLLVVSVGAGVAGWLYTTPALKRSAATKRAEFEASLATYFELVSLAFAGGKGPVDALRDPATLGDGPAFRQIRAAMIAADERREPPWTALMQLGDRLGVSSLMDLGASITLASDGAPVVDTLRAKAETMRDAAMAAKEARAESRSETLSFPIVLMFAGFIILFGYPALAGLVNLR